MSYRITLLGRPALILSTLGALSLIASCSSSEDDRLRIKPPMNIVKKEGKGIELSKPDAGASRTSLTSDAGPAVPQGRGFAEPVLSSTPPHLTGEPVSAKFEGIRLAAFINEVFGNILKVPYEIDDSLMKKDVIVTLSTGDTPLPRDAFYRLVTEVLSNYGAGVVYSNNVYRVVEATTVKKPIPRIIRTRANSLVPTDMRPLFLFQPINNIPVATMTVWLDLVLKDRVQSVPLPLANGLLLLGNPDDVSSASEIIQTLDQPYFAGSQSLKLSPAFWTAANFARQLTDILTAEGYSIAVGAANNSAIKLLPIDALNIVVVFGTGRDALQHVLQWATELDQPQQKVSSQGAYYFQVYNAKAKDLVDVVNGLVGGGALQGFTSGASGGPAATTTTSATTNPAGVAGTPATVTSGGATNRSNGRIMVDEARNGIIFVGSAEEFAQFRSLLQQMDRAPLQVMIECTIAEVNLKQGESLGVVFNFDDKAPDALNRSTVKSDGTGLFFSLIRDHGTLASQINAMADYNRLQVLSAPRLVTSSGKAASINVGTQVPIITTQEAAPNGQTVAGTSTILQSIQYRNTGVILNILPTINSSHRVELTVSQEVSDAQQNTVSGVQSPIIITRSLQTTLSLDDGQAALLGGMISENYSKGNTGIPYLKDIPVLGNLFKNASTSVQRTELIVLLTPYIIDGAETARQIRDAFRAQLGEWAQPTPAETAAEDEKMKKLEETRP